MDSGAVSTFHMIVRQITKFDGRRADDFLEWGFSGVSSFALALRLQLDNFQRLTRAGETVRIRCRPGDHLRDLGYPKSRPIQHALPHHNWFSFLHGSEISRQNTG